MVAITQAQSSLLQGDIQAELERREWAEPEDNVMAEYITVLLANGNSKERVQIEMDDLVGSDFDPSFLTWLFDKAEKISAEPETTKRKLEPEPGVEEVSKKQALPSGPRSLVDRLGPRQMQVRGVARQSRPPAMQPGMGPGGGGNGMRPGMGNGMGPGMVRPFLRPYQQFPSFAPQPGQQEMMAQMMAMQMGMAQMAEMMQHMAAERTAAPAPAPAPVRPQPVKVPPGTKLGNHAVSSAKPTPPLTKPTSTALCKFSVGCTNPRCPYSHPSPVADEKNGMVLSEEACEAGKGCKDAECTKSHVSPATILGESAGPSRLLCKFQNCTNPSCPFRHEDAEGKPIPPPALTAKRTPKPVKVSAPAPAPSSDDDEIEIVATSPKKGKMDGVLDDSLKVCRYGDRCTRADCKFTHPASRSIGKKPIASMNKSKKFGVLDPTVKEFKPTSA